MEYGLMGKVIVSARIENLADVEIRERGLIPAEQVRAVEVDDALVDTGAGPAHLNLGKSSESLQHIHLVECGMDSLPVETSFARILSQER